ncbi:MAG: transcriptional repressor NrdR [Oscillospiraceae bacterium]|nr:transcriptional repressor NrdR [Oscillospiraceae bacterium]
MRCPYCDYEDTKVIDSRFNEGKQRRRRICTVCGKRFTTYESIERPELLVLKKNNTYEPFDKAKLIRGLSFAVKKRPVSGQEIVRIADEIESLAFPMGQISTAQISDIALEKLKKLDSVAYVRFASVNKEFDSVERFLETIELLRTDDVQKK